MLPHPSLGPPPPLGATEELQQLGFAAHAALLAREPSADMLVRLAIRGAANLHLGRSHELALEARRLEACAAEARGAWRRCVAASREWLAGAAPLLSAVPRGAGGEAPPGAGGEARAGTGAAGGVGQLLEGRPLLDPMAAVSQQLALARALRRLGGAAEAEAGAEAGEEPEEDSEEVVELEAAEEAAVAAQADVQDAAATELTTGRRRRWREQRNEAAALEGDARTIAALLLGASHPFVAEIEAEIEALARNADHAQQRASCGKRPREHTDEGI